MTALAYPWGIIIFGRSKNLSPNQILDLEVMRRKFSHIADILTYDDLLMRLRNILLKFEEKQLEKEMSCD